MVRVRLEGLPDEVQRIADAMQAAGCFCVPKTAKTKMEVRTEMQEVLHLYTHFPNLATRRAALAGECLRESGCSVRRRHCNQRFTSFLGTFCGLGNRAWGYGGACTPIIALNRVSVAFAGILRGGCGCLV